MNFVAARPQPIVADVDPPETQEWLDALESVYRVVGADRAAFLLTALNARASELGVAANELIPEYSGPTLINSAPPWRTRSAILAK